MFIERLEELMKTKEITEYKLTQELKLSKSAVWNWKQGCQPTADKIIKLADYFEVSTDYLLGRESEIGIVNSNANLSADQAELLQLYNKMNFKDKNQLLGFAKALVY